MSTKTRPTATVQKFGYIGDIDAAATNEDVWIGEDAYTGFVAAAATTTIVSDGADDDVGGTGALTVTVVGLIDNSGSWEEAQETATMTGAVAVGLSNDYIRVYRAWVATAGTGEVNAGTIDIKHGATVLASIGAGYGQTLQACYTIPSVTLDGTTISRGNITRWYGTVGAGQSAYATLALQTKESGGAWRTRRILHVGEGGFTDETLTAGIELSSKADVRVRCFYNGVVNSTIAAGFDLDLY